MANHIDPVCGVQVEQQNAAGLSEHKGTTYYCHNEECMSIFTNIEQYANRPNRGPAMAADADTVRD